MVEVAQAISVFPTEKLPSGQNAAILVPVDTLEAILKGLKSLSQEVQDLKTRINSIEVLEEIYHGPAPRTEDIPLVREARATKRELLESLPTRVWALEQDLTALERVVHSKEPKAPGKKSAARIEKLKTILKGYGGSATFKQLQNDLDMNPSQFSQLVAKLDKRVFEVSLRPRGKKGEKILKLRKRINDPLVVR